MPVSGADSIEISKGATNDSDDRAFLVFQYQNVVATGS